MLQLKKLSRWLLYALIIMLIVIILAAFAMRFVVFPNIDRYKDDIAQHASKVVGQKITIGAIDTGWDGISPHVSLKNMDIFDAENRSALHLSNVEANVSWLSVPFLQPKLSSLIINQPQLTIRRKEDGGLYLAGIPLAGQSKPDFANWLLNQHEVNIKNAQVSWQDDMRKAPPLALTELNFNLNNPVISSVFGQHSFKLSTFASTGTPQIINASGRFVGTDVAKLNSWHGDMNANLKQADLSAFKAWLDYSISGYPIDIQSGLGDLQLSLAFADNKIESIKTVVSLTNLALLANKQSSPFVAKTLSGEIAWSDLKNTQTITLKKLKLSTNTELNINDASGYVANSSKNGNPWLKADLKLDYLSLSALKQITNYVQLPAKMAAQLAGFAPVGELANITVAYDGATVTPNVTETTAPKNYRIIATFKQLGITAYEKVPGFSNLSGTIQATEKGGDVALNSTKAMLDLKDILRWPVPADQLKGDVSWKIGNKSVDIDTKEFWISNTHLAGTINAKYSFNGIKGGFLDLSGKFGKGNAKFAPFYYPLILGKPTLHWLDTSILAGRAEDINVTVKGNLGDFPYVNSKNLPDKNIGIFKVTANISDALLEYGTGWPTIEGLGLNMLFEGKRMELNANKGTIFGNKIITSKTIIAQLDAASPILNIVSEVQGTTAEGLKFVNESPVKLVTQGFTESLKTAGNGKLLLALKIPMQDLNAAKYKGSYQITNGTIFANSEVGLPELAKLNGVLNFTESSLSAENVNTEILGGPAKFTLKTGADKVLSVSANGRISDMGIKKIASNFAIDKLQGSADWVADISIKKPLVDINIHSNLVGMAINMPPPFYKPANQAMDFSLIKKQQTASNETLDVTLGNIVYAKILRTELAGKMVIDRGDIGINMAASLPSNVPANTGLILHGKLDYLNVDDWLALLNEAKTSQTKTKDTGLMINKADISIQKIDVFNRRINALKLIAQPNANGLKLAIDSQEITGDAEWQGKDNGKVIARFKNLIVPKVVNETASNNAKKDFRKLSQEYPALDVMADNFEISGKKLGSLSLNAFENGEDWVIQKLTISNADSTLNIQGNWHNWTRNPNTSLIIGLSSNNIGKTFKRFGQPDAIKGGEAQMSGQINWAGSPHEFETSGLNGNLTFVATKGQFLKVDPSVGRLLGLLSLQSLPRRLSLDFRDLFSDGFAFDKISATAKIDNGILQSNDFLMDGPAAEAHIKGETNLKNETQKLKVKVVPHVSDSLSLAAFAGGPIAGVAAFVAQKILKDPFNKIIQSEYTISGTWNKPLEVKSDEDEAVKQNKPSPLAH